MIIICTDRTISLTTPYLAQLIVQLIKGTSKTVVSKDPHTIFRHQWRRDVVI